MSGILLIQSPPSSETLVRETAVAACKGSLKIILFIFSCQETQDINKILREQQTVKNTETYQAFGLIGARLFLGFSALKDSLTVVKNTSILGYRILKSDNLRTRSLSIAIIAGGSFLLGRISKKN